MQAFEYNNLYNKSKLYVQRALSEDREDDLFPFWLSLSLELLARSTLAKISPTLLAEVTSQDNVNLLYALGYETTNKPKSISISEVLNRLTKVNIEFTEVDRKFCISIIEQRNAELHSGIIGFVEYPASFWLSDFYRVCKILLTPQGLSLSNFLGTDEAKAAELMITQEEDNLRKQITGKVKSFKDVFWDLPPNERDAKINNSKTELISYINRAKIIKCPACENNAILSGEAISVSQAKLVDDTIKQEVRYLPTQFTCFVCGFKLAKYPELKTINLGGQFTLSKKLDPLDYHGIIEKWLSDQAEADAYGDE